jgi:hypothetical protein
MHKAAWGQGYRRWRQNFSQRSEPNSCPSDRQFPYQLCWLVRYFSKASYWFTYQSFSTALLIDEVYYSIHWTSKCLKQTSKNGCSFTPMWPSMKACSPKQKNRHMIDHYAYTITTTVFCLFPILKFPTKINGSWFGFSHQGLKKYINVWLPQQELHFNSYDWQFWTIMYSFNLPLSCVNISLHWEITTVYMLLVKIWT